MCLYGDRNYSESKLQSCVSSQDKFNGEKSGWAHFLLTLLEQNDAAK